MTAASEVRSEHTISSVICRRFRVGLREACNLFAFRDPKSEESMSTQHIARFDSGSRQSDDRVLPEVRVAAVFVIAILILAVAVLYFNPDQTDTHFAWTIKPALTAMAMGAGYMMGIYFFARVAFLSRWHYATVGFLPITAFTIWMLLATILHWDRFNHGAFAFTLWTAIYILTPMLVPFLWFRNKGTDPGDAAGEVQVPIIARKAVAVLGIAFVIVTGVCFIVPDVLIAIFPWKLTPLTARVVAGWMSFPGIGGLMLAREPRWSSWRLVVEAAFVGMVFFLLAIPRGWNDLIPTNPLTWVLLIVLVGSVIGIPVLYAFMQQQRVADSR
jgi:hypothetical protein